MPVTKNDLATEVAAVTGTRLEDSKAVIDSLLEAISVSLKKGCSVELRGFGTFKP